MCGYAPCSRRCRLTPDPCVLPAAPSEDSYGGVKAAAGSCSPPLTSPVVSAPVGSSSSVIRVDLQGAELWKRFHEIGTEMIITKAGR